MTLSASVDVSGPLSKGNAAKVMLANITRFMEEAMEEGAEDARRGFRRGQSERESLRMGLGRVSDHVIGRVFARPSKGGRRWHVFGVVQVYNEGLSAEQSRKLMAASSILEGRHNVIRDMTRRIAAKIRKADLTKGLE